MGVGTRGVKKARGQLILKECGQLCCLVSLFGMTEAIERPKFDCGPRNLGDAGSIPADGEIFSRVFVYLRTIPCPLYYSSANYSTI